MAGDLNVTGLFALLKFKKSISFFLNKNSALFDVAISINDKYLIPIGLNNRFVLQNINASYLVQLVF